MVGWQTSALYTVCSVAWVKTATTQRGCGDALRKGVGHNYLIQLIDLVMFWKQSALGGDLVQMATFRPMHVPPKQVIRVSCLLFAQM